MINLEQSLNYFLQREITFTVDNKCVKRGKLILCSIKDFYITFYLKHNDDQKRYELPYPFATHGVGKSLVFDYKLSTMACNNVDLLFKLQSLNKKKNSKIYDNQIVIAEVS
jgi:hypothetical protein